MVLGLLNIPYESVVLPYDDEQTPLSLTGVKMLPILEFSKEDIRNESLDIIKILDKDGVLNCVDPSDLDPLLSEIGKSVHSLCMPYWMWTPEFNEKSRSYFQKKKEVKRGPFNKLAQNKDAFISELDKTLNSLEKELSPFYQSTKLTIKDIMIASHLWGMYVFPEFRFSEKLNNYLQSISKACNFNYHEDFWRD